MAADEVDITEAIPSEIKERLTTFDRSLSNLENTLRPLLSTPPHDVYDGLEPLDRAKLDLVTAYTVNSLFWMYINTCGANPKEHGVKRELDRIRSYMNRVKEVEDKISVKQQRNMTVDKGAAKRMTKSALWQAVKAKSKADSNQTDQSPDTPRTDARRDQGEHQHPAKKKRKS